MPKCSQDMKPVKLQFKERNTIEEFRYETKHGAVIITFRNRVFQDCMFSFVQKIGGSYYTLEQWELLSEISREIKKISTDILDQKSFVD